MKTLNFGQLKEVEDECSVPLSPQDELRLLWRAIQNEQRGMVFDVDVAKRLRLLRRSPSELFSKAVECNYISMIGKNGKDAVANRTVKSTFPLDDQKLYVSEEIFDTTELC